MRIIFDHVVESGHFVSREDVQILQFRELLFYIMPPSKVCPQCETIVHARLKFVNLANMCFEPREKQSIICQTKSDSVKSEHAGID